LRRTLELSLFGVVFIWLHIVLESVFNVAELLHGQVNWKIKVVLF